MKKTVAICFTRNILKFKVGSVSLFNIQLIHQNIQKIHL